MRTRPSPQPHVSPLVLRTALVGVSALVLLAALLPAAPAAAQAAPPGPVDRLEAGDPIDLAVLASQRVWPAGSAGSATLATTADFADAMTGSSLSGIGPLLLTGGDALDDRAAAELGRTVRAGGTVRVLGGVAALSAQVEDDVRALGLGVQRLAGPTRIDTAVAVADALRSSAGAPGRVLLARAFAPEGNPTAGWADALSAAVPAGADRLPILLTDGTRLSPQTADALPAGVPVTVLGGTAAIGDAVAEEVAATNPVDRLAGTTRDETAVEVADALLGVTADVADRAVIAYDGYRADGWAFGLAAAALGVADRAPLVPVSRTALATASARLIGCGSAQAAVVVAGSAAVVPDVTVRAHQSCPQTTAPLVLAGSGLAEDLPIGLDADTAVARLVERLGAPDADTGWVVGCPLDGDAANERSVTWDGDLSIQLYDDGTSRTFRWWIYDGADGLGLRTDRGLAISATNADLAALYPEATYEDGIFGPMWTIPEAAGGLVLAFPSDGAPGTPISNLYGGSVQFCE